MRENENKAFDRQSIDNFFLFLRKHKIIQNHPQHTHTHFHFYFGFLIHFY